MKWIKEDNRMNTYIFLSYSGSMRESYTVKSVEQKHLKTGPKGMIFIVFLTETVC